jgi:hypothetical protein
MVFTSICCLLAFRYLPEMTLKVIPKKPLVITKAIDDMYGSIEKIFQ